MDCLRLVSQSMSVGNKYDDQMIRMIILCVAHPALVKVHGYDLMPSYHLYFKYFLNSSKILHVARGI